MTSASARLLPVTHAALVWTGDCGFPFTSGAPPRRLRCCNPARFQNQTATESPPSPPAQNNGATSAPVHYGIVGLEVLVIVGEGMQRSHYHAELYANNPRMLLERKTAGRSGAVKLLEILREIGIQKQTYTEIYSVNK